MQSGRSILIQPTWCKLVLQVTLQAASNFRGTLGRHSWNRDWQGVQTVPLSLTTEFTVNFTQLNWKPILELELSCSHLTHQGLVCQHSHRPWLTKDITNLSWTSASSSLHPTQQQALHHWHRSTSASALRIQSSDVYYTRDLIRL